MPEYVQFAPAESPDMVSLGTGDFSYTLPLGEVPGPYGGYPLSMSYHPGIGPNQEATWVGLGWTLNPGAINRNLRGAPDDQFHGGELAFLYSYSKSSNWGVGVGYTNGVFSLNMNYSSTGGYGITAGYGFMLAGMVSLGMSVGNNGVGLDAGIQYAGIGIQGSINLGPDGYQSSSLGLSASGNAKNGSVTASIGVHHTAGRGMAMSSGVGFTPKSGSGEKMNSLGTPVSPRGSGVSFTDGSLSLKAGGAGTTVSMPSSGIGVASSNGASSSKNSTATFAVAVPIPNVGVFSFGYSRSIFESWVRQATSEYLYGYMYQGGPAVFADARTDEMVASGGSGAGSGGMWTWNFKGRNLDRVGNPTSGDLLPAYDLFAVAANGLSGTFRAYGLTRHSLHQSVERLDVNDPSAQTLYYLLKEDAATRRQHADEFPASPSTASGSADFTRYAYDYCYDQATQAASYNTMDYAGKLAEVTAGRCSRYAVLKSRHLNEGNRMVALSDPETRRNIRSRMIFRFMGETGGNYATEDPEWKGADKYGQFELASASFQKGVNGVNHGLFGARRIEPILEDNRNNGRLQGFRITNPDGTQFFFTQPVRAIISADYTTNRAKGAPLFVDKHAAGADDNFFDIIGNAFVEFVDFGESLITDPVEAMEDLAGWTKAVLDFPSNSLKSFFWSSPKFRTPCDVKPDAQYNFSYTMKVNPYATQWLLTEVRGPEFVLLDRTDMTKNIGYQVKFNYAEPTWYKWRFPFAPPNTHKDSLPNFRLAKNAVTPENCHSDLYHGSFGVKELVFLQSIETASHRAEFVLNDPEKNPRLDGKGWIQDWTGRSQAVLPENQRMQTAMPIYLDAQVELTAVRVPNQNWVKKCAVDQVGGFQTGQTCWWERNLQYHASAAYLNMMPTQQQVARMTGSPLLISHLKKGFSASHTPPQGARHQVGFVFKGIPRTNLEFANRNKPVMGSVAPATGGNLAFGSTRLQFAAPIPMSLSPYDIGTETQPYENVYRMGARSCSNNGSTNCSVTLPASDTVGFIIPGTLSLGGPSSVLSSPEPQQPLMVFNDFVETDGRDDNLQRYLETLRIVDKGNQIALRQYKFSYDYEIQPGTLNSYDVPRNPDNSVIRDASGIPDLISGYPKAANPTMEELGGKLKLKSVQEFACTNADCSGGLPLPPFRFFYKNEKESPLRHGEDFHGTIIASSQPQDEWGLWNKHATPDNHKVRQDFAAYGGVSWSLDKVVDPAGGVLEVDYERDTYRGESYADDGKSFPITWRKCSGAPHNPDNLCIDVLPRRWVVACNRNDQLEGQYEYRLGAPTDADYAYLSDLYNPDGTVKPDQSLYFQLDGNYRFEVGCGGNIFGWKTNGCNRHRSVGTLGSGKVVNVTPHTNVVVPILQTVDPPENGEPTTTAPHVRTIEVDVPFKLVDATLKKAGEILTNRNTRTSVIPIKGVIWVKKVQSDLKGGDLRVKRLVRRDIGLVQTTNYDYATGEMAQYPDSVISTAFGERFSPTKAMLVMPLTHLPGISRVPGINDGETSFLPGPTVSYPRVTVTNISEDGHEVLNGKTVYEFITPETGVPQREGAATPFVKLRLLMERAATGTWGAVTVRFRNASGTTLGSPVTLTQRPAPRDNEFIFHGVDAAMPFLGARSLEVSYSIGPVSVIVPLSADQAIRPYSDLELTAYFDPAPTPDLFRAAVSDIKSSPFTPILVRNTAIGAMSTAYTDYTAFLGRAKTTEYHRWIPATPGERNDTRIPANAAKYKLLQADTVIYSSVAPSGDDRFYAEGQSRRLKIGQDEEHWEYMRKIQCTDLTMANATYVDNCDFNSVTSPYAGYKGIEVTVDGSKNYAPKRMSYFRAPAFIVETVSKSGFNGSTGPDDYMVTRVTNHRFDPLTGTPTLSVAHSGRAGQYVPAKATRSTPAYHVNTPLAATLFERNMLNSNFREDAYTWTVAPTPGDANSGAFINFNSDDLSSPTLLPPRLTRVKITPFSQQYLNFAGAPAPRPVTTWHNPILGMGEFTPRFKLTDAAGQALLADNAALFTPSFLDGTFLRQWNGVEIESVNRFLKPLGKKDVYGIRSAHRYDPSGFHQIGVFANAGYNETALLTAEGRSGNFPDQSLLDLWRYTGGSPAVNGTFIRLTGNFSLSHNLDLQAGQTYLLEAQLHSTANRTCQAAFYTDAGGVGDAEPLAVKAGLNAYQVVLDASGYTTLPGAGLNRLRLSCSDGVAGAVQVAYLRAYPERAETISYLYDVRGNMIQSVNEQNVSSYYDYDASGNLAAIRNDDGILFSTHKRELTNVATP